MFVLESLELQSARGDSRLFDFVSVPGTYPIKDLFICSGDRRGKLQFCPFLHDCRIPDMLWSIQFNDIPRIASSGEYDEVEAEQIDVSDLTFDVWETRALSLSIPCGDQAGDIDVHQPNELDLGQDEGIRVGCLKTEKEIKFVFEKKRDLLRGRYRRRWTVKIPVKIAIKLKFGCAHPVRYATSECHCLLLLN